MEERKKSFFGVVVIIIAAVVGFWLFGADYENLVEKLGDVGLFIVSFLSASIFVFFPSEPVILLSVKLLNPLSAFIFAFLGSLSGAIVNYYIGNKGVRHLVFFLIKRNKEKEKKAEDFFKKYGSSAVVIAPFIPFIGDALTVIAGALKMDFKKFLFYSIIGRAAKIGFLIYLGNLFMSSLK